MKAKNYKFIKRKLLIRALLILGVFCCFALFFKKPTWIISATTGLFVSFLMLTNLMQTNFTIINTKSRKPAFINFYLRMIFVAIPLVTCFYFNRYFNLIIMIPCLFSFQILLLHFEIIRHIKSKRKK